MLLKDQTAIITGASRGCGAATALRFAREGAAGVVNYAHDARAAEAIVGRITAKGALVTLTRSLARDYGKFNITANLVTPGLVWTDLDAPQPSPHPSPHAQRAPLGRVTTADDVAKACVFFASDLADFVTGANLPVCGGLVMQ
jgi:NAD(P)-dependent dehydrogenase (short-subunit alcohol dehydrogenase family)